MFRWIARGVVRLFLVLAVGLLVTYGTDSLVFLLRGSPTGVVTIQRFMGIPLKGHKEEYDYLGPAQAPCAISLFPHAGKDPCWKLRRNPNQWENL